MTHSAAHFHIHRKTVPRFGTVLGALALGLGVFTGAATPGAADCGTHQDQFRPSFPPGGWPADQYRGK